jgi:hypothetical protein
VRKAFVEGHLGEAKCSNDLRIIFRNCPLKGKITILRHRKQPQNRRSCFMNGLIWVGEKKALDEP